MVKSNLNIRVDPCSLSTLIHSSITLFLILLIPAAAMAQELAGQSYKAQEGVVCLGGPGTSSASYDLQNTIGVNTGSMSGSLYALIAGLQGLNSLPSAAISNYDDSQPTEDVTPTLQWTYTDADNDPQIKYQLQVGHEDFVTPVVDTGVISSAGTSFTTPILPQTEERTLYKWRVRVYDGYAWSGWALADNGFILTTGGFLISGLGALTAPAGEEILQSTWQKDNDPYFYWEAPGTGLEVAGYSYSLDAPADDEVDITTTYYYFSQDSISDGAHTFYVKAKRSSGLWGDPSSFIIWVDTTGPSANNLAPDLGAVLSTDRPELRAVLSDSGSGVDPESIEMRINQAQVSPVFNPENSTVTFTPSVPLSEGEITVSLTADDIIGNEGAVLSWSFVIDTEGPSGSILINNGDETTTTHIVTLNITAEDATTDITEMMLSNDGIFDTEAWEPYVSLRKNWALPAISGLRKVYARVKDAAGNISDVFFDDITLVIVAPDTYILSGPSGITQLQTAQFTFRSSLPGSQFSYKFDNEDWSDWSGNTSMSQPGLSEGNHYFMVKSAKDLNNDGLLQLDEVDPTPALRVWTISLSGTLRPPSEPEKPVKVWEQE